MLAAALAAVLAMPLDAQVRTPPKKPPAAIPTLPAPTAPALPVAPPMPGAIGIVADSLHGGVLIGALVSVEGTNRSTMTDAEGKFRIDSIPPGEHRISISHAVLDSIAIALGTKPITFEGGKYAVLSLAVPSAETVAGLYCPAARRVQGPSVVIGRVLDADTDQPMVGAKLSLLWEELAVNKVIGVRKVPRVRSATTDSSGVFSICGVPDDINAHLQASRDSILTADVAILMDRRVLATAIMRIASPASAIAVTDSTRSDTSRNRPATLRRGSAVLTGRVTNLGGVAIVGARVDVPGTPGVTLTRENGEFSLGGLPSGTQSVVVRQVGFAPLETPVDLTTREPKRVLLKMKEKAAVLATVEVIAQQDRNMSRVGFSERKRSRSGTFITREDILRTNPTQVSDIFRTTPGIRVQSVNGRNVLTSTRGSGSSASGCINYYLDRSPWQSMYPGDVDQFLPVNEIAAAEVYSAGSVPAEFTTGGSSCTTIVMWTHTYVGRGNP